jgi:hypothetical protein
MTPLLLGAAWLLFVVSCFTSMMPEKFAKSSKSQRSKAGGSSDETT